MVTPELAASKFSLARRVATASGPLLASAFVPVPGWCSVPVYVTGGMSPSSCSFPVCLRSPARMLRCLPVGLQAAMCRMDVRTVTQMPDVGSRRPGLQRIPSKGP